MVRKTHMRALVTCKEVIEYRLGCRISFKWRDDQIATLLDGEAEGTICRGGGGRRGCDDRAISLQLRDAERSSSDANIPEDEWQLLPSTYDVYYLSDEKKRKVLVRCKGTTVLVLVFK